MCITNSKTRVSQLLKFSCLCLFFAIQTRILKKRRLRNNSDFLELLELTKFGENELLNLFFKKKTG